MSLWLKDMHLGGTITAFRHLGFRLMDDFCDLSLTDVQEYFPFLKLGDAIRLSKNIALLTPEVSVGLSLGGNCSMGLG